MEMTIRKATKKSEIVAALLAAFPVDENGVPECGDFGVNECPDADAFADLLLKVVKITDRFEVTIDDAPEAELAFGPQKLEMEDVLRLHDVLCEFRPDELTIENRTVGMWWD